VVIPLANIAALFFILRPVVLIVIVVIETDAFSVDFDTFLFRLRTHRQQSFGVLGVAAYV
jgi:hypothetical protein